MFDLRQNKNSFNLHNVEEEDHWISVSDLMAGLMMVFLFISIALMRDAMLDKEFVKEIAVSYQQNQVSIYENLLSEFEGDLESWGATIDKNTLSFEFQSPEVLFSQGKITLKPRFEYILADFFPRYLAVLSKFDDSINEVRIEGHTSSVWNQYTSADEAYFNNMALSQGRTRSVLQYVLGIPDIKSEKAWVKKKVAAVGLSSAHLKMSAGRENPELSRRVTFRVLTNAEIQMRKVLEASR